MTAPAAAGRAGAWLVPAVATGLGLALAYVAADIFLLLFVAILLGLYLRAWRDGLVRWLRLPEGLAFAVAIVAFLATVTGLVTMLIPPLVEQVQQLSANLPTYVEAWQRALRGVLERSPRLRTLWDAESGKLAAGLVAQAEALAGEVLPRVVGLGHTIVNVVSVLVMGIFLALRPAEYREWAVALLPAARRDGARALLGEVGATLRAWIVGQLLAMAVLAVLTSIGLAILDVPFALTFGVFTGAVAIVPFFGTMVSSLLPALFVLGGDGWLGLGAGVHAALVVALGFVIHVIEANLVVPIIMKQQVEIPPVLSMLGVLLVGRLLGVAGLPVAVPLLAVALVVVRRYRLEQDAGDLPAPVPPPAETPSPLAPAPP